MKKGERTAQRILDVAELKFAENGFERTNLREIAEEVGIQEPGLYRHFSNKEQLYASVLERALVPLEELLFKAASTGLDKKALIELPALVFDLFLEHPPVAFLFQQALVAKKDKQNPMQQWIDKFFKQAESLTQTLPINDIDQQMLALRIVALFNVCIGFFVSRGILNSLLKNKKKVDSLNQKQRALLSSMMASWL